MIKLSPSSIGVFKECPRCFWLDKVKGIKQPKGVFPSLPGGMDRALKARYDQHRVAGTLPPELHGKISGKLFPEIEKLNEWRNWRRGMICTINGDIQVGGAVDDAFFEDDGLISPFDYKTRGAAPKADAPDYYGHQLDIYALLFQENGLPVSGKGHLAYYWQDRAFDDNFELFLKTAHDFPSVLFRFSHVVETKDVNPDNAVKLAVMATECLKNLEMPASAENCAYCIYKKQLWELFK